MTSRNLRCAVLALVTGLSLAAGTTAAHADAFRHRDATGDVRVTRGATDTTGAVESTWRPADIQQFTVLHGRWALSIATTLRDLRGFEDRWQARIVTSKGDTFYVNRLHLEGYPGPFSTVARDGKHFECDGIYVSRTTSGVIAKVPTRCLGNPWKVRVGVYAESTLSDADDTGHDDALLTGRYADRPALSPWIAR